MELVDHHSIIGIDVSKKTLDVAISGVERVRTYRNNTAGFAELIETLQPLHDPLIVLEATGEYHIRLVEALEAAGHLTAICNPAWVRGYAKAMGWPAKTDKADARVLVAYGKARNPQRRPLLPPLLREIKALLARRDDLVTMRTMERNRAQSTLDATVKASTARLDKLLSNEIDDLAATIAALIASDPELTQREQLLRTTPGIGEISAAQLLVTLPELGTLSPKQLAALVGVAPYARDSGKSHGKRFIRGGRTVLRKALYQAVFAAVCTTKRNHALKEHYTRLREAGKPHNLAMVATMRHLLIYLNVMVRENLTWDQLEVNKVPIAV